MGLDDKEVLPTEVAFLQNRIALAGLIGASLNAFAQVLSILPALMGVTSPAWSGHALQFLGGALLVAAWLSCRRGNRSLRFLRTLEVATLVACTICFDV